jgi:DSF synthase
VLASDKPGVFNLGGDLDLFKKLIGERDRAELLRYGRACIDVLYSNYQAFDLPVTTISLVQGDALGGGLRGSTVERHDRRRKKLPLRLSRDSVQPLPWMGAYSFLDRRIGQRGTEDLI